MQKTSGLHALLTFSWVYSFLQNLLGARRCRKTVIGEYLRLKTGDKVLDIGCGPADILLELPDIHYTGADLSPEYIETAKKLHGIRGTFLCASADQLKLSDEGTFDLVMIIALFHHLEDEQVRAVCRTAHRALKPGGRLVTFDNCFIENQPAVARWLISQDRGKCVRTPDGYLSLIREYFPQSSISLRHDLLRVPYTHAIAEAVKQPF